jgi:2-polyprenyl-6-methoxyphenol hydroxylase-like FAD-dependent oxidoreductase
LQVNQITEKDRAIVIGASMGGLMVARALANHFPQVMVFERDALPSEPAPRKAIPQGRHAHVLLARGIDVMEDYFPIMTKDLVAQGAIAEDMSETSLWFSKGRYHRSYHSGIISLQVSRPLLETCIRQRLCALPNVVLRENCDITGLLSVREGNEFRVCGVKALDRARSDLIEETLRASLVVDAGGRGSPGRGTDPDESLLYHLHISAPAACLIPPGQLLPATI